MIRVKSAQKCHAQKALHKIVQIKKTEMCIRYRSYPVYRSVAVLNVDIPKCWVVRVLY